MSLWSWAGRRERYNFGDLEEVEDLSSSILAWSAQATTWKLTTVSRTGLGLLGHSSNTSNQEAAKGGEAEQYKSGGGRERNHLTAIGKDDESRSEEEIEATGRYEGEEPRARSLAAGGVTRRTSRSGLGVQVESGRQELPAAIDARGTPALSGLRRRP